MDQEANQAVSDLINVNYIRYSDSDLKKKSFKSITIFGPGLWRRKNKDKNKDKDKDKNKNQNKNNLIKTMHRCFDRLGQIRFNRFSKKPMISEQHLNISKETVANSINYRTFDYDNL